MKFIKKYSAVVGVSVILLALPLILTGCGIFGQAPEANISTTPSPPEGNAPLSVDFDASGSSDPDGEISSYDWEFGDPDSGEDNTATGVQATHTYDSSGTYTVTLEITDDQGKTDQASVTVEVSSPSDNQDPVAEISTSPTPAEGDVGLTVDFDGSGSSDPDGSIASYEWDFDDGDTASGQTASHTFDSQGNYAVTLTVTDDKGAIDQANTVVIIHGSSGNETPTASIATNPTPPEGGLPLTVEFDGAGSSDPDGSIVSYEWNFGDPKSDEDNTASGSAVSHTYYSEDTFTARLTVTDNDGASDSATVEVEAEIIPPAPPG